jgi:isopentenyldiphosphate isomerase
MNLIDTFTDRYEHTGTEDKKIAHERGLWHRTFSCLVFDPVRQTVLLQKKAPGRTVFDRPDYADFTVGGHYQAGETIPDGTRELHEELGLTTISYPDLHPIGIRQTAVTLAPGWLEREFQHWHLLPLQAELEEIPLDDAEVAGLVQLDLTDAIHLAAGDRSEVPAHYLIRHGDDRQYQEGVLSTADLIPGYLKIDQLYLRLFTAARRYIHGERAHLFW